MDGSLQFSDLRGLLRVPAVAPSIVNLPTDRVRDSDLTEIMWRDPSGIDILLAPPRVEMAEMVTVRDIEKVLGMLRKQYEFVIIDTRPALSEDVLVFLDAADIVLQVLTYDSMAIRGLVMAGETFDAIGYPPKKLQSCSTGPTRQAGSTRRTWNPRSAPGSTSRWSRTAGWWHRRQQRGNPIRHQRAGEPIAADVRRIADALVAALAERSPALARR